MFVNKILKFMVIFFPVIFFGIYGFMNMSNFSDILYYLSFDNEGVLNTKKFNLPTK